MAKSLWEGGRFVFWGIDERQQPRVDLRKRANINCGAGMGAFVVTGTLLYSHLCHDILFVRRNSSLLLSILKLVDTGQRNNSRQTFDENQGYDFQ